MMPIKPKIFISYSIADHQVATALYNDLSKKGSEVFQFEESATPGESAWGEVLAKIELSDIFILLASRSSVKSKPVQEEIKFAHYQYLNANKPSVLLPLVLEPDLQLPKELRTNNIIAFHDYAVGFSQLSKFLKLGTAAKPQSFSPVPPIPQTIPIKTIFGTYQKPLYTPPLTSATSKYVSPPAFKNDLLMYVVIILLAGVAGMVAGWFLNNYLADQDVYKTISVIVSSWTQAHPWLPLTSKLVLWLLEGFIAYHITEVVFPIDRLDYVSATVKSVGAALLIGLIWSVLFRQVTTETYPFILICISISIVMVLRFAIVDNLL